MSASPKNSSIILLPPPTQKIFNHCIHQLLTSSVLPPLHPQVKLSNANITLNQSQKELHLTYDIGFPPSTRMYYITNSVNGKINILYIHSPKNKFKNETTTLTLVYKQFRRSTLLQFLQNVKIISKLTRLNNNLLH